MNKIFFVRFFGVLLILGSIAVFGFIQFRNREGSAAPLVFSERTLLSSLYDSYIKEYWEASSGRTLDKEQNNLTTSEGQSYTMLRAVWQSDKPTFDKTWKFTKEQLQHKDDHLFSWKWGQKNDGSYGVLVDQGGQNTASDGDSDIALALLMAAGRWQQSEYLDAAKQIIPQIWEQEVLSIKDKNYLASNNIEKFSKTDAVINPSYFAPYAYRLFSKVDDKHDWNKLVNDSYDLTDLSLSDKFGLASSAGLPPDWLIIDKATGEIKSPTTASLTTNYSFDAFRTPWRLALDYQWNNEARAKTTLQKMSYLSYQWQQEKALYSTYSHDGKIIKKEEVPAIYGGDIGYFVVTDENTAKDIYEKKLKSLYDPTLEQWNQKLSYYSDNWAWFGIALYNKLLDNPAKDL